MDVQHLIPVRTTKQNTTYSIFFGLPCSTSTTYWNSLVIHMPKKGLWDIQMFRILLVS